jgi:hypothetical protein
MDPIRDVILTMCGCGARRSCGSKVRDTRMGPRALVDISRRADSRVRSPSVRVSKMPEIIKVLGVNHKLQHRTGVVDEQVNLLTGQ